LSENLVAPGTQATLLSKRYLGRRCGIFYAIALPAISLAVLANFSSSHLILRVTDARVLWFIVRSMKAETRQQGTAL
jgi:ABC-type long-subunit fatty acid transport system fused permease/ATPase subunit